MSATRAPGVRRFGADGGRRAHRRSLAGRRDRRRRHVRARRAAGPVRLRAARVRRAAGSVRRRGRRHAQGVPHVPNAPAHAGAHRCPRSRQLYAAALRQASAVDIRGSATGASGRSRSIRASLALVSRMHRVGTIDDALAERLVLVDRPRAGRRCGHVWRRHGRVDQRGARAAPAARQQLGGTNRRGARRSASLRRLRPGCSGRGRPTASIWRLPSAAGSKLSERSRAVTPSTSRSTSGSRARAPVGGARSWTPRARPRRPSAPRPPNMSSTASPAVNLLAPGVEAPVDGVEWMTQGGRRPGEDREGRVICGASRGSAPRCRSLPISCWATRCCRLRTRSISAIPKARRFSAPTSRCGTISGSRAGIGASAHGLPWSLPRQDFMPGVPWHISGSLLGLDIALAPLALRRLTLDGLPDAPKLSSIEREAFAVGVSLMEPARLTDRDRDAIAAGDRARPSARPGGGRGHRAVSPRQRKCCSSTAAAGAPSSGRSNTIPRAGRRSSRSRSCCCWAAGRRAPTWMPGALRACTRGAAPARGSRRSARGASWPAVPSCRSWPGR